MGFWSPIGDSPSGNRSPKGHQLVAKVRSKQFHTRNHKSEIPSEHATESPFELCSGPEEPRRLRCAHNLGWLSLQFRPFSISRFTVLPFRRYACYFPFPAFRFSQNTVSRIVFSVSGATLRRTNSVANSRRKGRDDLGVAPSLIHSIVVIAYKLFIALFRL